MSDSAATLNSFVLPFPFIGLLKLRFIACHVFILIVLFMRRFVSFSMLLRYFYVHGKLFAFYHKVKV